MNGIIGTMNRDLIGQHGTLVLANAERKLIDMGDYLSSEWDISPIPNKVWAGNIIIHFYKGDIKSLQANGFFMFVEKKNDGSYESKLLGCQLLIGEETFEKVMKDLATKA